MVAFCPIIAPENPVNRVEKALHYEFQLER